MKNIYALKKNNRVIGFFKNKLDAETLMREIGGEFEWDDKPAGYIDTVDEGDIWTDDDEERALAVASAKQEGGSHYKDYVIQPTEFIFKNNLGFIEGNVIKYVMRHRKKGGLQDLQKAKHYIDLLIEYEYTNKN